MAEYRVEGMDTLLSRLDELDATMTTKRKILVKAMREAMNVISRAAASQAPHLTGKLSREVIVSVIEATYTRVTGRVGPSRQAFYGLFSEIGTAHSVKTPWLEPAFEAKINEAKQVLSNEIADGIMKAIA